VSNEDRCSSRGRDSNRYPFPAYPNGWFRVAYSDELRAGQVLSLELFGTRLVAFRTVQGTPFVLDAYCPHMGADMGVGGRVDGEALRCPFHDWLWGGDGRCLEVPYASRIPARAMTRAFEVVEKNGILMAWWHSEGEAPQWQVPDVDAFSSSGWREPVVKHWKVNARWLDMNENCVDQAHFRYIHGTLAIPATQASHDGHVFRAESHIRQKAPGGEAEGCLVTVDHGPGFQVVTLAGLIDTVLLNTATPMDEETTDVSFMYTVKTEGHPRKEKLAAAVVDDLVTQFHNDLPIWENKSYWSRPMLCDGDGPIGEYRDWMKQFFTEAPGKEKTP